MKTRRRGFIKTSAAGAAGMVLSRLVPVRAGAREATRADSVTLGMSIWGTCLYELTAVQGGHSLRVGFLNSGPPGCDCVTHYPELVLVDGGATKVSGNAQLVQGAYGLKWVLPSGTLTIDPTSVKPGPPLVATGIDDGRQACPDGAGKIVSLGFIPRLKTKPNQNHKLDPKWHEGKDVIAIAVLDRGTFMARPPRHFPDRIAMWKYRTDDSAEDEPWAFSDTTGYEVELNGHVKFSCGDQELEIGPGTTGGRRIELQLNAMPPESASDPKMTKGDPLPHFCSLYGSFHEGGDPNNSPPNGKMRYVPRLEDICYFTQGADRTAATEIRSPAKYCSGGIVVRS